MRKLLCLCLISATALLGLCGTALAGATLQISDDSKIDFGFRLQTLYLNTDKDLDGDGSYERYDDFKVRRARLRVGADITQWVNMFIQTEFAEDAATGADMRIIDAFILVKPHRLAWIYMGENMAPVTRQNLTSSGALMAVDRPGITYKVLTWGTRALSTFSTATYGDSDAGLRGDVDVRDTGLVLMGNFDLNDMTHLKYYLGVADGVQKADKDSERYSGRLQLNLFDKEDGFYHLSTYLGKKKTLSFAAAYDTQADVAFDQATGDRVDYTLYTFDGFLDYPVGPGTLTCEAGYINLDLDDAGILENAAGTALSTASALQSQGDGYYAQAGYYINQWQPWIGYEQWSSDAANDKGSFDAVKFGLTYYLKGHNANIKVGYEIFNTDALIGSTNEDTINTFVTGLYVTY